MIKPLSELVEPGWAHALADVSPPSTIWAIFFVRKTRRRPWLPASHNILRATVHHPVRFHQGADCRPGPYPTPGHPVGLSFCVAPNVHPLPKSLINIYKELVDDLGVPMPTNGDLTPWTERGVMLLNRCLTVASGGQIRIRQRLGGSHRGRDSCVERAHGRRRKPQPLVAILWGRNAQSLEPLLTNASLSNRLIRVRCPLPADSSAPNHSPEPIKP